MEVIAQHCRARSSAQKLRLVANLIRGKTVLRAIEILNYTNKKAAYLIKKVVNSAVANAQHNNRLNIDNLQIKKIFINVGPSMKRMMPRAKGRADHILKRTSHITVILSDK